MRTFTILGSCLLLASLLCASCSSNDKDPITTACDNACKLDSSSPCASHVNDCVLDCRSWGTKYQTDFGTKCMECVVGSYQYIITGGTCGGGGTVYVSKAVPTDRTGACYSSCVKSDGAM
jgi:hypothetical protein